MNFILFDDETRDNLLPLTFTRPISELRVGIFTIREKWEKHLDTSCSYLTVNYLSEKYACIAKDDNVIINSAVLPSSSLVDEILKLRNNQALYKGEIFIACWVNHLMVDGFKPDRNFFQIIEFNSSLTKINFPWDIFSINGDQINEDFNWITQNRNSAGVNSTNTLINPSGIFIEPSAKLNCAILNATEGPVYIGNNAEVMEGAIIRGPFVLCDHSTVKMGAKIYGPTTIGPHCKVGGELNNCVFIGYANKAHDGFLGNSVIGEWCNIGADTNSSNLKNNYAEVKVWNYVKKCFLKTGLTFCGLIMGDHSKCGINTMFNTGTVVGVSANIFGAGFPRTYIPSFSWGGAGGFTEFKLDKALEVVEKVMSRRKIKLTKIDRKIVEYIYNMTLENRIN